MKNSDESLPLASLSIGHLRILRQLLTSESVTETANFNNMSQPSVSRILRKMRGVFDDPLLVRSGERLVATERGGELCRELASVLEHLETAVVGESEFRADRLHREFRIACTDSNMVAVVPKLISRITSAGHRLIANVRSVDPAFDVVDALESGELDVVVDTTSITEEIAGVERMKSTWLYDDEVVLMVREHHPLVAAPPPSIEEYLGLKHLAPHPSYKPNPGPIDGVLVERGCPRRIHAFVPEYNLVPYILAQSDFVFTTCRRFAEHYASFMSIRVLPAPRIFPPVRFRMLWHERTHHSAAGKWLRNIVRECARS